MSTYTFTLNRDQVITGALRLVGAISQGETPNATQIQEASDALNILVKSWINIGLPLWRIKSKTMSLVAGKNVYNTTTDLAMEKPLKMLEVYLHDNNSNTDMLMNLITRNEYVMLSAKANSGFPNQMYYNINQNDGDLYLFPTPDATAVSIKSLTFWYHSPFADSLSGTDPVDFPVEWVKALKFALAVDLSHEYGVPLKERQLLAQFAEKYKMEAEDFTQEEGSVFFTGNWRDG